MSKYVLKRLAMLIPVLIGVTFMVYFILSLSPSHTLEADGPEELVINCDEVDCTTLVEYVLAETLTPKLPSPFRRRHPSSQ